MRYLEADDNGTALRQINQYARFRVDAGDDGIYRVMELNGDHSRAILSYADRAKAEMALMRITNDLHGVIYRKDVQKGYNIAMEHVLEFLAQSDLMGVAESVADNFHGRDLLDFILNRNNEETP